MFFFHFWFWIILNVELKLKEWNSSHLISWLAWLDVRKLLMSVYKCNLSRLLSAVFSCVRYNDRGCDVSVTHPVMDLVTHTGRADQQPVQCWVTSHTWCSHWDQDGAWLGLIRALLHKQWPPTPQLSVGTCGWLDRPVQAPQTCVSADMCGGWRQAGGREGGRTPGTPQELFLALPQSPAKPPADWSKPLSLSSRGDQFKLMTRRHSSVSQWCPHRDTPLQVLTIHSWQVSSVTSARIWPEIRNNLIVGSL